MVRCPVCFEEDDPAGPGDSCHCGHVWTPVELIAQGFDPDNFEKE